MLTVYFVMNALYGKKHCSLLSPQTHLGAGYSNLRSSVDVDSAVGLPGDGAADRVGDAHSQSSPLLTVAQGHEAVGSLPWRIDRNCKM